MTVKAAKRKIIPSVIFASLAYTSYRALTVVKADPGILACNMISGTSLAVSSSGRWNLRMFRKKQMNDFLIIYAYIHTYGH